MSIDQSDGITGFCYEKDSKFSPIITGKIEMYHNDKTPGDKTASHITFE